MLKPDRNNAGFTLFEIIIIVAVLGILALVTIPKYQAIKTEAKIATAKGALSNLRSGISVYYAKTAHRNGDASWPPIDSLETPGAVMKSLPVNPFQHSNSAPDSIVLGTAKGMTSGTRGGWAYNPSTGEIWPNTKIKGENNW